MVTSLMAVAWVSKPNLPKALFVSRSFWYLRSNYFESQFPNDDACWRRYYETFGNWLFPTSHVFNFSYGWLINIPIKVYAFIVMGVEYIFGSEGTSITA